MGSTLSTCAFYRSTPCTLRWKHYESFRRRRRTWTRRAFPASVPLIPKRARILHRMSRVPRGRRCSSRIRCVALLPKQLRCPTPSAASATSESLGRDARNWLAYSVVTTRLDAKVTKSLDPTRSGKNKSWREPRKCKGWRQRNAECGSPRGAFSASLDSYTKGTLS